MSWRARGVQPFSSRRDARGLVAPKLYPGMTCSLHCAGNHLLMSLMLSIKPLNSKKACSGALICGSGGVRIPVRQCCGKTEMWL